jgi:hypothetical protein
MLYPAELRGRICDRLYHFFARARRAVASIRKRPDDKSPKRPGAARGCNSPRAMLIFRKQHDERSRPVKPSCSVKAWRPAPVWMAVSLSAAVVSAPAVAADNGALLTVVAPNALDHPPPEATPGGTVVLRGSGPASPDIGPPPAEAPTVSPRPEGWDVGFDTTGFDRRFDRSGLLSR